MKKIYQKFEKWFDLNLGWFFTNGQDWKQERFRQYLIKKYGKDSVRPNDVD